MNNLFYGWIICYIISYTLHISIPFMVDDGSNINNDKLASFLFMISWILSIAAFIMFIVWLTKSTTSKNELKILWISAIITFIISVGLVIFLVGNSSDKIVQIPTYFIGYSITIFIGSFIGFLVKK